MKPGFRTRIQLALMLTVAIPLGVGVVVAWMMLNAVLGSELPPETRSVLEAGIEARQQLFKNQRDLHELQADRLAADLRASGRRGAAAQAAFLDEVCRRDETLIGVEIVDRQGARLDHPCPRDEALELRRMTLARPLAGGGELRSTFGLPEAAYADLQRAGAVSRALDLAERTRTERLGAYWIAFGILFGGGVLLAAVLGSWLARRTTRRIQALASATRSVSRGDLEVEVPVSGTDELAQLADAFNRMVREVRDRGQRIVYLEKISSWQEIARRLAHEIKNPLTPIQLAMQQVTSGYRGEDPRYVRLLEEAGEIVREEVETLRRLVTEFSDFARLPDVSPAPADLSGWVADFLRQQPDFAERARIDLRVPDGPVWACIDRTLMRRVLDNLVRNAIQAAEDADLPPRVHVTVEADAENVHLSVADEGPGIEPGLAARVFDPYFTTKHGGTGLGLPISKKIVLQHEGRIDVHPRPGGGTRFVIRLPRIEPPAAAASPP